MECGHGALLLQQVWTARVVCGFRPQRCRERLHQEPLQPLRACRGWDLGSKGGRDGKFVPAGSKEVLDSGAGVVLEKIELMV